MRRSLIALAVASGFLGFGAATASAAEGVALPHQEWSFQGLFGTYDRAAVRRGFQVYKEVCAGCHALSLVRYRNLEAIGFSEDEVKAIAAEATVMDGPGDDGEMFERPGRPSDAFVAPFPNDNAAKAANGGALPPELSLMTKARVGGPDYVHAILTGYHEPPADIEMQPGLNYNAYFPGHQIAMPAPLAEDAVEYADGTPATVEQMAHDVTTFLNWAAEPELETRKQTGVKVLLFLIVFTGLLYATKRRVWAKVH
jgi:ubiquinol-cytochrome c reductase cytochrome c1 subunit